MLRRRRIPIRLKLMIGFCAVLILTGLVGYLGYYTINGMQGSLSTVERRYELAKGATQIQADLYREEVGVREALNGSDTAATDFDTASKQVNDTLDRLTGLSKVASHQA
ncbi:MAG: MCP four helix bundle domain-containing protein, partial [Mycobacterium leprae]